MTLEQRLDLNQKYEEAGVKHRESQRQHIREIAERLLMRNQLTGWQYVQICEKNRQLIF